MNIKIKKLNSNNLVWKSISITFLILFSFLISAKVEAASIFFSPALGDFHVGDTFKVSVLVNTQGTPINSIETNIDFPKEYLDVVFVSKASSIFSLWIQEPTYSNSLGTISFTGGLPTPGYNGINGKVMEITFKAKAVGVAKINYSSSAVRANDGLGTDVLQSSGEGEYTITVRPEEKGEVVPVTEVKPSITLSPEISSLTHPDSEKWYSNKNPKFAWVYPNAITGIRISYDENPVAIPEIFYSTSTLEMEFSNVRDGIYYLHLQVREKNGWSKVSDFKFKIDTERPLNFTITEIDKGNATKTQSEFTFNAVDELSGLDYFEIRIDSNTPETTNDINNQVYKTAELDSGRHAIFIKAYDKAGNYVLGSDVFNIKTSSIISFADVEKVISNIKEIYKETIIVAKETIKKVGEVVNSPTGSAVTKTISTAGLITGASMSLVFAIPASLTDLWLILARLMGLFFGIIGLRRKNRPWGTVYDSITKRPLDPVYVSLIDLETGKEIANAITDLDGRYGFLVVPGRYGIETTKTNYSSPSMKMKGKTFDEVYNDLYFGGEIKIEKEGEVITKNIPMDSLSFDWNEFTKHKMNINTFIKDKDIIRAKISKLLFVFGAVVSVIALIFAPVPYNFIIAGLYLLFYLLNFMVFKKQNNGVLLNESTGVPLSFAIVKVYREGSDTPMVKKVADKYGKYYILVPSGRYHISVDNKNDDGSYTEVFYTKDMDIKDGIVNYYIEI